MNAALFLAVPMEVLANAFSIVIEDERAGAATKAPIPVNIKILKKADIFGTFNLVRLVDNRSYLNYV
tara:strand:- start:662 stop:862 length:201 start_codon:yes stop_codon:yes gene_type:complete